MYNKKGVTLKKRILSAALSMVMVVPMLTCVVPKNMSIVNAANLANPRISGGVTTWDLVYFGKYPQSDSTGIKKDPIKWRVLNVNGNDAFLLADIGLDAQRFHNWANKGEASADIFWSTSCIRSWLNGYDGKYNELKVSYNYKNFINTAFETESEKKAILETDVSATTNPQFSTVSSPATKDKVFLLSYEEVTNPSYGFTSTVDPSDTRKLSFDTYIVNSGGVNEISSIKKKQVGADAFWWLRTRGMFENMAMLVKGDGSIYEDGNCAGYLVDYDEALVRPAIHLDISKTKVWSYAGTVTSSGTYTTGDAAPVIDETEKEVKDVEDNATYKITKGDDGSEVVEYVPLDYSSENVVVPSRVSDSKRTYDVTAIAANAFKDNKIIKSIVIPDSVTKIGEGAFSGCSNLQTVVLGKNVKYINAKAFYKCTKIKKIVIPVSVEKIGKQAFFGCKNLKSVTIKTTKLTNKKVGAKAFKGTHKKATFKVPKAKLKAYKKLLKDKGAGAKAKIKK